MEDKEVWRHIGECFIETYYNQFDNTNRVDLSLLYSENACLSWEGSPYQGRTAIANKLVTLPFTQIKHSVTGQDIQPTIDGSIVIMVFGQLKADEDAPLPFHQVFQLKNNNGWVCTNDVFRLGIHNVPA